MKEVSKNLVYMSSGAVDFSKATRRLLFSEPQPEAESQRIPGAGRSAAATPERHLRVKVTMNLDGDVVNYFKERAKEDGRPYQTIINQVLREYIDGTRPEQLAGLIGQMLLEDPSFLERIAKKLS